MHTERTRAAYREAIPLGRYGTVGEIAAAVAFLTSQAAELMNSLIAQGKGDLDHSALALLVEQYGNMEV